MNKKVLAVVGVLILLLLGGWYFLSSKKSNSPLTQLTPNSTSEAQTSETTSLKDLINKGLPQTCTFENENSKGTVYIDGSKVRQDFEITMDDKVVKSHIIIMDNTMYNWGDGEKTGIKMTFDPKETPVPMESPNPALSGNLNTDTSMNYKCGVWLPDSGKFTLPTGVTFSSFELPSQIAPKQGATTESSQCTYCNSLTGDDKTQCLKALSCK